MAMVGATIYNAGLWEMLADDSILVSGATTNTFVNAGTIQKLGGTGSSSINWNFSGNGTLSTPTGKLYLDQWVGTNTVSANANLALGTVSGLVTLTPGIVGTISGGSIKGGLTVSSNSVVNWSGDISGAGVLTVAAGATLTISNSVTLGANGSGGAFTNFGTVIWAATSGSYLTGYGGAVIYNGGFWQALTDNILVVSGATTNSFINAGTLQKLGGTGSTTFNWNFNTTGSMSTLFGKFDVEQWIGSNTFQGTATLTIGVLKTVLTVASNAVLNWSSGDVSGTGSLIVAAGGTLTISNGVTFGANGNGGALTNFGTVVWAAIAGNYLTGYGGAAIHNAGLWEMLADDTIVVSGATTNTFANTGTIQKLTGPGSSTINWDFRSSGTTEVRTGTLSLGGIAIQTAGLIMLDGGNLSSSQPFQLSGGTLAGTNTFTGTLTNSAVVSPGASPGLLTINGSLFKLPRVRSTSNSAAQTSVLNMTS